MLYLYNYVHQYRVDVEFAHNGYINVKRKMFIIWPHYELFGTNLVFYLFQVFFTFIRENTVAASWTAAEVY